jgi:hypothetical protein
VLDVGDARRNLGPAEQAIGRKAALADDKLAGFRDDDRMHESVRFNAGRQARDVAEIAPRPLANMTSEMARTPLIATPLPARAGGRSGPLC